MHCRSLSVERASKLVCNLSSTSEVNAEPITAPARYSEPPKLHVRVLWIVSKEVFDQRGTKWLNMGESLQLFEAIGKCDIMSVNIKSITQLL